MSDASTTVNVPLLRKAVEWAEAEAAKALEECHWWQEDYVRPMGHINRAGCGTAYCIAGYVGQMLDARYVNAWLPDGIPDVDAFATDALGITDEQASNLFHAHNSIEDVRQVAEGIAGERL